MSELIEKVEHIIYGRCEDQDDSLDMAKAALKAIKDAGYVIVPSEPTEAMLDAVQPSLQDADCYRTDWATMIDAALGADR